MNKLFRIGSLVLVFGGMVLGCTLPSTPTVVSSPQAPVAAPVPDSMPFEGMWMSDGDNPEIIVFTKDGMYRIQPDSGNESYSREQFATIVSHDLAANHLSLRTQWIRVNGTMQGFDAPNFNVTFLTEGDSLRIGIGWDDQFASNTEPIVYHRK